MSQFFDPGLQHSNVGPGTQVRADASGRRMGNESMTWERLMVVPERFIVILRLSSQYLYSAM